MEEEHKKIPILCECGCFVRRNSLFRHKNSKKHLEIMSSIQDIKDHYEAIIKKMIIQKFQKMIATE